MMRRVRTIPAIQWIVTQANWTPITGKNAVTSSVSIVAAMSQWKVRDACEWRSTRSGTSGAASGAVFGALGAMIQTYKWCPTTNRKPAMAAAQSRSQATPTSTSWPQGFGAVLRISI